MIRASILLAALLASASASFAQTLKIRVDGEGYLRFSHEGKVFYAKAANLKAEGGRLVAENGYKLTPGVAVNSLETIRVELDGTILQSQQVIGKFVLAQFESGLTGLDSLGFGSSASRPKLGNPGEGEFGVIRMDNGRPIATVSKSLSQDIKPGPALITITDACEVSSTTFSLADVAKIQGKFPSGFDPKSIILGDTPPLGVERILDRGRIFAKIRSAGYDVETLHIICPEKVKISKQGQTVSHDEFLAAAIKGASAKGYTSVDASSKQEPSMNVPQGDYQLVCETIQPNGDNVNVSVGVYVSGKRFNGRNVLLKNTTPAINIQ